MADERRILRKLVMATLVGGTMVCSSLLGSTAQAQWVENRSMVVEQSSFGGWGGGWRTTGIATYGPGLYAGTWYGPWGYPAPWENNYVASQYSAFWSGGYPPGYLQYGYGTGAFDFVPAVYSVQRHRLGGVPAPLALPLMNEGHLMNQGDGKMINLPNPGVANEVAQPEPRPLADLLPKGAEEPTPPPGSSLQARQRAGYFVRSGDRLFQQQRYQESLARYKDAAIAASDQAEPHLRKALAYLATNRPEYAAASFRTALENDAAVLEKAPTFDELMGGNDAAKSNLIEAVARRAVDDPENPDLLFVVACVLLLDGQVAAAERYLGHVERLSGEQPPVEARPAKNQGGADGAIDL